MNKMMIRGSLVVLFCCAIGFAEAVFAAKIQVSVDRNPVSLNESFQLIFSADQSPDDDPDFSPLDQNFEILSQNSSSNMSWINGKMSRTIRWTITAMAKHAGDIEVPQISFGSDLSTPATLHVNESDSAPAAGQTDDIFIEVEAAPKTPYVQAQVLYTVKIYSRVEIARASLDEPDQTDAVVEKLGDDKSYQTQIKGVDYIVTERRYAIFPQKSGKFTIEPLVLTADVVARSHSRFDSFFGSAVTRTLRASSKAVELHVKPAPASFTGKQWLATERLDLSEAWSGDIAQIKVGEPMTRTLTVQAKGATVGQLPELHHDITDAAVKFYPDQPVLEEQKSVDGLTAVRSEKIAMIPSAAGEVKLPAIEIPWFNTRTQKIEVATIPEKTIHVAAAVSAENQPIADPAVGAVETQTMREESLPTGNILLWQSVSGALAFGWLATLLFFGLRKPKPKPAPSVMPAKPDEGEYRQRLKKACSDHDPTAAKNALLEWGQQKFQANSLGGIAIFCDARLRDEIQLLNRVLYSSESEQWQGKRLFQAFCEYKAREQWTSGNADDGLEKLFRL